MNIKYLKSTFFVVVVFHHLFVTQQFHQIVAVVWPKICFLTASHYRRRKTVTALVSINRRIIYQRQFLKFRFSAVTQKLKNNFKHCVAVHVNTHATVSQKHPHKCQDGCFQCHRTQTDRMFVPWTQTLRVKHTCSGISVTQFLIG